MTRHIPNLLTCCNLLCGCLGVVFVLRGSTYSAAYFVWIACVFDFLDGFAARMLKVSSPIGKELDSLADMVSFGLLPSVLMYTLLFDLMVPSETSDLMVSLRTMYYLPFIAFSIAVFSAIRLAIFNVDDRQSDSFRGLPTPANALMITALPLLTGSAAIILQSDVVLIAITVLSSYLMVSGIELFALKFKNFSWQDNKIRFTFLLLSVLLLVTLQLSAIPVIILLYIALSLGVRAVSK